MRNARQPTFERILANAARKDNANSRIVASPTVNQSTMSLQI
jgi:hypothetical protein